MSLEEIRAASEAVRRASDAAEGEAKERLEEQAEQLARLAGREGGPDHGRVARHQHALRSIAEDAGEAAGEHIEEANDRLDAYRETVEGV